MSSTKEQGQELSPLAYYHEFMEEIHKEMSKDEPKVPHISLAEPRIGRPLQQEYIEYIRKNYNKDIRPGDGRLLPKVRGWRVEKGKQLFCGCCGMRLRARPTNREFKEKVRAKQKMITAVGLSIRVDKSDSVY